MGIERIRDAATTAPIPKNAYESFGRILSASQEVRVSCRSIPFLSPQLKQQRPFEHKDVLMSGL
jgi:hypothetical protein